MHSLRFTFYTLLFTATLLSACGGGNGADGAGAGAGNSQGAGKTGKDGKPTTVSSNLQHLTTKNPALPDQTVGASDPNDTGISSGEYPYCHYCAVQGYDKGVAGCTEVVGTPQPCQGFCHVPEGFNISWDVNPPTSGNHYPSPEGTLGEHVMAVPRGRYIHSMEHGAVILMYNCPNGCNAELQVLRQVVAQTSGSLVIMTPDPLLSGSRFAATSWGWVYRFDAPDAATLTCFVKQHDRHGRECPTKTTCAPLHDGPMLNSP